MRNLRDIKKEIDEIHSLYEKFKSSLISFLVYYGVPDGNILHADKTKYKIRDSILFRFESVLFHLIALVKKHQEIINYQYEHFSEKAFNDIQLIVEYKEQIHFLFDDIIFNSCSFFDYLANLMGFMYLGMNSMNIKLNGIAKAMRDKNNPISKTKLGPLVVSNHKDLITHLYDYRSRLIHRGRDLAGGGVILHPKKNSVEIDFEVDPPAKFVKRIKMLKEELKGKFDIIDTSLWLIEKAIKIAIDLFKVFSKEMS